MIVCLLLSSDYNMFCLIFSLQAKPPYGPLYLFHREVTLGHVLIGSLSPLRQLFQLFLKNEMYEDLLL